MSPELEKLRNLLSCVQYNSDQHSQALLEEWDSQATLRSVQLEMGTGDWFSFNPDKGRHFYQDTTRGPKKVYEGMSPLLNNSGSSPHNRACDAVILVKRSSKIIALFLELKSAELPNASDYKEQLKSTACFWKYLTSIARDLHNLELPALEERFAVFHTAPSMRKTTTQATNRQATRDPNNPRLRPVQNGATVYLRELLGEI